MHSANTTHRRTVMIAKDLILAKDIFVWMHKSAEESRPIAAFAGKPGSRA
jgi:hypothetical protein